MSKNSMIESLRNYVNGNDDFAILLNGEWGTGKTYFLKHEIDNKEESRIFKDKIPIYLSIFGYDSLDSLKKDITDKIYMSCFNMGNKIGKELKKVLKPIRKELKAMAGNHGDLFDIGNKLLADIGSTFMRKRIEERAGKIVVVIDDIERISEEIKLVDFLGYILTDLIEDLKCRVILVGNVSKIQNVKNDFNKISEKIVSRVIPFSIDFSTIKDSFLDKSDNQFVRANSDWIGKVLLIQFKTSTLNLRTLKFIFSTFEIVDQELREYFENHKESSDDKVNIERSAFLNIFVIAIEHREGRLTKENLQELRPLMNTRNFIRFTLNKGIWKNSSTNTKNNDHLAKYIVKKYHCINRACFDDYIFYDEQINHIIFDLTFDSVAFIDDWYKLFKSDIKASQVLVDKTNYFRDIDDDEFENLQIKVLKNIDEHKMSFDQLINVYDNFDYFEKINLLMIHEDYQSKILQEIEWIITKNCKNFEILDDYQEKWEMKKDIGLISVDIQKKIDEIFNKFDEKANRKRKLEFLTSIFEGNYRRTEELSGVNTGIDFFETLLDSGLLQKYVLTAHPRSEKFTQYIYNHFVNNNYKKIYPYKEKNITNLCEKIKEFMRENNSLGKIGMFNLNELIDKLNLLIETDQKDKMNSNYFFP
ncbi:P-loop NTPase fold protein [Lactobacillus sp. ESL0791]|uniref:P-loop NTPase fold protein n=1 Tax=Lactobacillus sp. ESL0791 TaxID=2983234 RepID=UPI0023F95006|nr:P-loop NTPase fold protein [Lactobacillus sp. ESL0791]MDF7639306.1 P-loop NTPase fold protein [Lactobacillus sp. ESL0791]